MAFPKYAIFEFDDKSIEIGETQWISDLEESGTSLAGFPYEEKFEVFWPKNSAIIVAKGSKGKVNPPPPKDVKLLDAVILAFNDDVEVLRKQCKHLEENGSLMDKMEEEGEKRCRKTKCNNSSSEDETDLLVKPAKVSKVSAVKESEKRSSEILAKLIEDRKKEYKTTEANPPKNAEEVVEVEPAGGGGEKENELAETLHTIQQCLLEVQSQVKGQSLKIDAILATLSRNEIPGTPITRLNPGTPIPASLPGTPGTPGTSGSTTNTKFTPTRTFEAESPELQVSASIESDISQITARCRDGSHEKFIKDFMVSVWPREYMATHSLTGGKSSKKDEPEKQPVDPVMLNIIQMETFKKFKDIKEKEFREIVRIKLNNEDKLLKRRSESFK